MCSSTKMARAGGTVALGSGSKGRSRCGGADQVFRGDFSLAAANLLTKRTRTPDELQIRPVGDVCVCRCDFHGAAKIWKGPDAKVAPASKSRRRRQKTSGLPRIAAREMSCSLA